MKVFLALLFAVLVGLVPAFAQVPTNIGIQILKAEDARRYDTLLDGLLKSSNADVRRRSALAAGRIGDEAAIPVLAGLLENDPSTDVRVMAAFAIGEIESIKGAETVLRNLRIQLTDKSAPHNVRLTGRLVEAAGKIAAANPKDEVSKELRKAIIETLDFELGNMHTAASVHREVFVLGLTAVLRARAEKADIIVAKFLASPDPRVRADAANTMTRLRARNANAELRNMLLNDKDANVRANAARALGSAEERGALGPLLNAAVQDEDSRVRVSAIRSLASLKEIKVIDALMERGKALLELHAKSKLRNPGEKNELLEIAATLARLFPNTENARAVTFLTELRLADHFSSAETEVAFARIAPEAYLSIKRPPDFGYADPQIATSYGQGLGDIATTKSEDLRMRAAEQLTAYVAGMATGVRPRDQAKMMRSMPELTRAMAAFKPDNLDEILRGQLVNDDVFVRAAAAELLSERPVSKENIDALKTASSRAMITDKTYNDAQLAILDAVYKLDKKESVGSILMALNTQDYLVRKKAFELLAEKDLQKDFPGIPTSLENARARLKDKVLPYSSVFGTKLGQLLNTDADYRRALSRKNGSVKAVFATEKGTFTINFFPEEAPLTVDNFIKLARSGYFNGVEVHRVVPNFVMQDGDPRGDGNGGPGWSIRCEINMLEFDRGAVGMALSGKDTGGSQWFVTHSPQPHLDGGYTVFGHVNEADMKVVDNIVRGDKILTVKIIEGRLPQKGTKGAK